MFGGDMSSVFGEMDLSEASVIDIALAHISIGIEDGKASGTMEDITVGSIVSVTLNKKGEATYVLVSANSGFRAGDFGG